MQLTQVLSVPLLVATAVVFVYIFVPGDSLWSPFACFWEFSDQHFQSLYLA